MADAMEPGCHARGLVWKPQGISLATPFDLKIAWTDNPETCLHCGLCFSDPEQKNCVIGTVNSLFVGKS